MKRKTISALTSAICLIAIYLMTWPSGVKMTWADPNRQYVYYFSYFSPAVPGASGNWLPILTVVLVISAFIMLIVQIIKPNHSDKWSRRSINCLIIAGIFSLISFAIFDTTSVLSGIITGLILLAAIVQYRSINRSWAHHFRKQ